MKHKSVVIASSPIEFIEVQPLNPLISKCQIKVCYVGDNPNRNKSVITKDVARQMANSLPGSPIVGYFNKKDGDFEEHNRELVITDDGKLEIQDTTRPYGFVDLGAKVWFQKFTDDDKDEREYLMTEGYLWTGQYPECERIITKGDNQSMELDPKTLNAEWSKDKKGNPEFFIINEAIISKLCILGDDYEPCFEGAHITAPKIQFSFEDSFKEQLFSMMQELKDLLNKGGEKVFTRYAVEIGDALWTALYSHVEENYSIEGVYEDDSQKYAILKADDAYYRLNFSISDEGEIAFAEEISAIEGYTPEEEPQFALEDVQNFIETFKKKKDEEKEDKSDEEEDKKTDNSSEEGAKSEDEDEDEEKKKKKTKFSEEENEEKTCSKCGKPEDECKCKKEYALEEIPEYVELLNKYSALEASFNQLTSDKESLESKLAELVEFKNSMDRKDKEAMIESFYMLSDEDKADVITNIDTYSLDDIEAKLSVICVRNKVSFDLEEKQENHTTFNLNDTGDDDDTPAWVKAALAVAKNMN